MPVITIGTDMKYDRRFERRTTHATPSRDRRFARMDEDIRTNWNPAKVEINGAAPVRAIATNIAVVPSNRTA